MYVLIVDNANEDKAYFTPKLIRHVKKHHKTVVVHNLEEIHKVSWSKVSHVILSGGPLLLSGCTEAAQWSMNIFPLLTFDGPILGICFGMQVMTVAYGGSLRRLKKFIKGHRTVGKRKVSYAYNDTVSIVPPNFKVTEKCGALVAAMRYKNRFAVQYHPEDGNTDIIDSFLAKE